LGLRITKSVVPHQRTHVINALRAHLAEFGIVAAQGDKGVKELLAIVADQQDARLPVDARASVIVLAAQLEAVQTMLRSLDQRQAICVAIDIRGGPSTMASMRSGAKYPSVRSCAC
jgi:hypothetical protein